MKLTTILSLAQTLASFARQLGKPQAADLIDQLAELAQRGKNVDGQLERVADHLRNEQPIDWAAEEAAARAASEDLHSPPKGSG